ncbi:hypothetical protein RJ640_020685 [Escallonia rubra]|uniref:Uncharacterized protein n=1 Tax=Escallonia rubra TaxID=112253 RepID=A0AA88REW5_9ASTE|nr:hypothetical protein RJ640_020685 [Escallonia rubra]
METSLRYGGDTTGLKIHAKEKFSLGSNAFLQVQDRGNRRRISIVLRKHQHLHFELDAIINIFCCICWQLHGELNTRTGAPSCLSAALRYFLPDFASVAGGVQYDRNRKLRYCVRGKKAFPVTTDGLLKFNIKGQCDADKDFIQTKSRGAAELSWSMLEFQKNQDVRVKIGYEVIDKVPYIQIRENNWTLNADSSGKWNVRYDL